jgi:pimeloyl-ACP methyl ester carboxylesterase
MKALRQAVGRVLAMLAVVYCGVALFGCVVADRLIFQPQPVSYRADLPGLHMVTAEDDTPLAVLHLPNAVARHTLFYLHGNAEDLGHCLPLLRSLHAAGFAVLAFDYRGYGRSGGRPTEKNVFADTRAVLAFAQAKLGLAPGQVIAVGRSVGSGPAVELATKAPLGGLVLISPMASAFRVMTRVKVLPFDQFDNLAKAGRVRCPTLIFHGTADEVIAFVHGQNLFAALPEPKRPVWIDGAGHNDIFHVAGDTILREIVAFEKALPAPRAR